MYRNNWNMGPRGRNFGHRGFRPGIFLGIIGLFFFGWIAIAAAFGALSAVIMAFGSVLSGLAHFAPHLIRTLVSSHSFAIGIAIGLVWYFRTHRRNRTAAEENRESAESAAAETEAAEAPAYRTFSA